MERDGRYRVAEARASEERKADRGGYRSERAKYRDRSDRRDDSDRRRSRSRSPRRRSRSRSPRRRSRSPIPQRRSGSPRYKGSHSGSFDRSRKSHYSESRHERRDYYDDRPRTKEAPKDNSDREPNLNGVPSAVAPQAVARIQAQLAKRRALWQNKDKQGDTSTAITESQHAATSSTAGTATVWKAAAFKEDQDGKMTAKFKRLMGMKGNEVGHWQ
ncbi:hypothetical protein QYM36_011900 [Artemia franciscana]|uniref:Arginine/serine-rich coiled-coil protein 2 n=1 Tax=Artemia franciscana TaxID=6661 RepID=A0AA88HK41_ARTSF|nr:hypothetical protein QYM36_011900 [Artemia franciscana]